MDWTLNIGEQALDIRIIPFNQSASSVFVLGERNFFCLKDNGQIRFMKKLDCSPSCFLPYCSGGYEEFLYPFYISSVLYICTHIRKSHTQAQILTSREVVFTENVMKPLAFIVVVDI